MNKEVQSIIRRLENVNSGEPWFGRAVCTLLEEVDPKRSAIQPNGKAHSMLELLWHMNTWAAFTLKRLEKDEEQDMAVFETLDWRTLDHRLHTWKKGLSEFKATHKKITAILKKKDDRFLKEIVDHRKYNYRFLLNGFIEHNIYHAGQIAYLNKFL